MNIPIIINTIKSESVEYLKCLIPEDFIDYLKQLKFKEASSLISFPIIIILCFKLFMPDVFPPMKLQDVEGKFGEVVEQRIDIGRVYYAISDLRIYSDRAVLTYPYGVMSVKSNDGTVNEYSSEIYKDIYIVGKQYDKLIEQLGKGAIIAYAIDDSYDSGGHLELERFKFIYLYWKMTGKFIW